MKILIITPRIPYPPYRGDKLKIFNICKNLAQKNYIKVLSFHENKKSMEYIAHLRKLGISIDTVKLSFFNSLLNLIKVAFSNIPFQVAYFSSNRMKSKIKTILENEEFDVIYFHLIRTAQFFEATNGSDALKVIDFTDAVSLYLSRFVKIIKNPLKKFAVKIELKRVKEYEKISGKFDTLFVCSQKDKEYLEHKKIHHNIQILKNGFDASYFSPGSLGYEKHRIIFTGNMPYFPNKDAVSYFSKKIFPKILKKYPDSKFYIVGQKPPYSVKKLKSSNIIVTGFVEDIKQEYLKSEVNVVPIRFGAGTLNKVIESLALGVPVIATSVAVVGLPDELQEYIFIANSEDEFVEKVCFVFNNPPVRAKIINEAAKKIQSLLAWEKIVAEFESYISSKVKK
ncbi:glycosyltransferase [Melioribacteraceae bacterium 4301-Me]|uniref:glycosyltransferase n=1 Tax=Pyranulibacter aquaticus TaxID=3163344 RepID=UPI00359B1370